VIDGVHGNTTSLGPRVALDGELVLGTTSLEQRLVGTATTGNDTNHTAGSVLDDLLGTGGELDTGLAILGVVANNGNVVTGGTAKRTTVTRLLLDVGDDGTLGHGGEREDVADGQGSVLTGVDELAGVHALVGDEGLGDHLVTVGVTELDLGEGSTTAGIVDDLLDDTTGVTVSLSEVEGPELGRGLVQAGVGRCKVEKKIRYQHSNLVANLCGFLIVLLVSSSLLGVRSLEISCWNGLRSHSLKMEPRPFLWLRMTRPMATV
jgi:hypothetical protein